MASIVIAGDTSGSVTISAPAIAGTPTLTLPTTSGTIVTTGGATSLTTSGNLTFTGTGNRITGDFSNATVANRVLFQTSTTNGSTVVGLIPNGTGTQCAWNAYNGADTANAGVGAFLINTNELRIQSNAVGTGSYVPLTMYTGGSERLRIDTSGNVGIGTTTAQSALDVGVGSTSAPTYKGHVRLNGGGLAANGGLEFMSTTFSNGYGWRLQAPDEGGGSTPIVFQGRSNSASWTEHMRIQAGGNVAIGTNNTSTYRVTIANNGGNQLRLYATDVSTSTTNSIDFWYLDAGGSPYNNTAIRSISAANAGNGSLLFYTRATSGSLSERMRINSVGSIEYTTYNSGNIYGGDAMISWDNVSAFSIDLTTLFPNLVGTGSAVSLLIQGITWNGGSASSQSFLLNGARGNSSWAFSTANTVNTGTGTSVTPSASGNTLTITFGGGGQYGNAKISIIARN